MKLVNLSQGISMVEVIVVVAIVAILAGVAAPNLGTLIRNAQIRNTAEAVLSGLQVARMEAVRRNTAISFHFTTNLKANCALSVNHANWVVSFDSPVSACNAAFFNDAFGPLDLTNNPTPRILKKYSAADSISSVQIVAPQNTITFDSAGRVSPAPILPIIFSNPTAGACAPAGNVRCMNLVVSSGGQTRMCDPSLASPDPRRC